MKTLLKWPGGKEKELPIIRDNLPSNIEKFVEPFVGGGAVFFDINSSCCYINDKSKELINFYTCIQNKDKDFIKFLKEEANEFKSLSDFVDNNNPLILDLYNSRVNVNDFIENNKNFFSKIGNDYNTIFIKELNKNLNSKLKRSKKLEETNGEIPDSDRIDNIEAALKSAYYMYIRHLLNHPSEITLGKQGAVFFFIREFCYSSMFRYNKNGLFNVPYGGISYNRKDFHKKINYLLSNEVNNKLTTANITCQDFEDFLTNLDLSENDFIFLDPPYDSEFSTYAKNEFTQADQIRLCNFLKSTKAKILLVIKNTDFIYNLYKDYFTISSFDKKYLVSFMNRNNQDAKHLIITNF